MKRFIRAALALVVVLGCTCCNMVRGSGVEAEETRQVPQFSRMEIDGSYVVKINVDKNGKDTVALKISGDDNILPLIDTEVSDGKLTVKSDKNLSFNDPLSLVVNPADMEELKLNGSGDVVINGIDNKKTAVIIAGSGDVKLAGKTGTLRLEIAGSGDIDAIELIADEVVVEIAGSGEMSVCAEKNLDVEIAGSGTVNYYCNPAEVKQDITGSGELVKK